MGTNNPPITVIPTGTSVAKISWLKKFGSAVWNAAKEIGGFLGSSKVQTVEQQVANLAEILLPTDAPLIQGFQIIIGKIFKQAVVTETQFANISNAGAQKFSAVIGLIGPELDQWVANNFAGTAKIQDATKAGLVNAIVALQNDLTAPVTPPSTK